MPNTLKTAKSQSLHVCVCACACMHIHTNKHAFFYMCIYTEVNSSRLDMAHSHDMCERACSCVHLFAGEFCRIFKAKPRATSRAITIYSYACSMLGCLTHTCLSWVVLAFIFVSFITFLLLSAGCNFGLCCWLHMCFKINIMRVTPMISWLGEASLDMMLEHDDFLADYDAICHVSRISQSFSPFVHELLITHMQSSMTVRQLATHLIANPNAA